MGHYRIRSRRPTPRASGSLRSPRQHRSERALLAGTFHHKPDPDINRSRRWPDVADVLIRDVPDAVLAGVDAHAARMGISRVEYIRRRLAADAATVRAPVSVQDLRDFAETFADLADDEARDAAWR
jgi:hypothetical protein